MKTINFACKKDDEIYQKHIIPALLSKQKKSTIRHLDDGEYPKYARGDILTVGWKLNGDDFYFCDKCGLALNKLYYDSRKNIRVGVCPVHGTIEESHVFHRDIGNVMIKNVYTFTAEKKGDTFALNTNCEYSAEQIAKTDGFPDADTLLNWLNNHYDLAKAKRFVWYVWIWT